MFWFHSISMAGSQINSNFHKTFPPITKLSEGKSNLMLQWNYYQATIFYSELGPFKNALLFKRKASERGAKRECRRRDSGLGQYHGAQIAVPQPNEECLDL